LHSSEESTSGRSGFPTDGVPLVSLWLFGAAVVTASRFLNAADPGHDVGRQVLAAQNLLAGRGLSYFSHSALDLSEPANLVTLTGFSAGYSLIAAALIALGLDVRLAVKVIPAAATILGWWGWGRLSNPFLQPGCSRGGAWRVAASLMAMITPLLFTIPWSGTDILLWASIPWALEFVIRGSRTNGVSYPAYDFLAGAVCGLAVLMRYASVFLPACVGLVVLWQSHRDWRTLVRRWAFVAVGVLPPVLLQIYINYVAANVTAMPGGLFNGAVVTPVDRFVHGISLLYTANEFWAFWVPGKIRALLTDGTAGSVWPLLVVLVAAAVLAIVLTQYLREANGDDASRDARLVSSTLFFLLPCVLLASTAVGDYDYVADRRYYWPLLPLATFVAYSVAARNASGAMSRLVSGGAALYVIGYMSMICVFAILLFTPSRVGATQRLKLMGDEIRAWPSFAVRHELSPARQLFLGLHRKDPGALLLTSQTAALVWDPGVDRSKVVELSCPMLEAERVTGPAHLIILTFDQGAPDQLWFYAGTGLGGGVLPSDCFQRLPGLRLVQRFPVEGLKVLEARVPAGQRVVLKP